MYTVSIQKVTRRNIPSRYIIAFIASVISIILLWLFMGRHPQQAPLPAQSKKEVKSSETNVQAAIPASLPVKMTLALFDDFNDGILDRSLWLIAKRQWGGDNHGVVPDNVSEVNGCLVLEGHGNNYMGPVGGINKYGVPIVKGTKVGAAIATKDSFASGRYEISAKLAPETGVCSAFWTYYYRELYPGDSFYHLYSRENENPYIVNHEIDIEFPGRANFDIYDGISFDYALLNTWRGTRSDELAFSFRKLPFQHDVAGFHTYRFDWFTGEKDGSDTARVDFYIDDQLIYSSYEAIPTIAGQFWMGVWFPSQWAGTPYFTASRMYVDWVRISTFNQSNDEVPSTAIPSVGWAEEYEYSCNLKGDRRARQNQISSSQLVIANFDMLNDPPRNLVEGRFNCLQSPPSVATISLVEIDTMTSRSNTVLQIRYERRDVGWCGLWMRFAPDDRFLDASAYRKLTFRIKGMQGGEDIDVSLSDQRLFRLDDGTPAGKLTDFLPNGITQAWQKVEIQLSPLLRLDKSALNGFALIANGHGTIYIDDVVLEN